MITQSYDFLTSPDNVAYFFISEGKQGKIPKMIFIDEEPETGGGRRPLAAAWAAPFASITWSRFNGSAALPRRPLSLCPGIHRPGPVGSPQDVRRLGTGRRSVKAGKYVPQTDDSFLRWPRDSYTFTNHFSPLNLMRDYTRAAGVRVIRADRGAACGVNRVREHGVIRARTRTGDGGQRQCGEQEKEKEKERRFHGAMLVGVL